MLQYTKEISTKTLEGFECGIAKMDDFIHHSLDAFLKNDSRFNFYVVRDGQDVVAMFVTSRGMFIDHDDVFDDIPFGKPWGYLGKDFRMHSGMMYPTLEIDYLAVRKDLRGNGFGSAIIDELSKIAQSIGCYFLTVDAYHDNEYSAIPFYEKCGFFAIQELSEDYDSLRMACRI